MLSTQDKLSSSHLQLFGPHLPVWLLDCHWSTRIGTWVPIDHLGTRQSLG